MVNSSRSAVIAARKELNNEESEKATTSKIQSTKGIRKYDCSTGRKTNLPLAFAARCPSHHICGPAPPLPLHLRATRYSPDYCPSLHFRSAVGRGSGCSERSGCFCQHRKPWHSTFKSYGDVAAQRQGACRWRIWRRQRLPRERGTVRSSEWHLDRYRQPRYRSLWLHRDVATQRQSACCGRCQRQQLQHPRGTGECGTVRSGERHLDGQRQSRSCTLQSHGDVAVQRPGACCRR